MEELTNHSCSLVAILLLLLLQHHVSTISGVQYMFVSPYPARVYVNAPPGVPVVMLNAFNNETGIEIEKFHLDPSTDAGYFTVSKNGIIQSAKTIDRSLGYEFQFFAIADTSGLLYKHVKIKVSVKNIYPPTFTQKLYQFQVYRFAPLKTSIGTVEASDADEDPYNSHFTIYPQPRQEALKYVNVTSSGDIILESSPPDDVDFLTLDIAAKDAGSPELTSNTTVLIQVTDYKQPDTFCVSSLTNYTTLCWKNPMPGRDMADYNVVANGLGLHLNLKVDGDPNQEELCYNVTGTQQGQQYTFKVTVATDVPAAGEEIVLTFYNQAPGFYQGCVDSKFNICNFLQPCQNEAVCRAGPRGWMDYICSCTDGWQGQNCTMEDLCSETRCQNNGKCVFQGDQRYICNCDDLYFGDLCQHFNVCSVNSPCMHGGMCQMYANGTYSCLCPDHFTEADCSVPDPCSPSPCGKGGKCNKLSETEANCTCHFGYYGNTCSETNECQLSFPCLNGGTCSSTGNSTFTCTCVEKYMGPLCETFNPCSLQLCLNNGTCQTTGLGSYNCTCVPGFYGDECQHYDRCHSNPCHRGSCNTDTSKKLCSCPQDYYGSYCEIFDPCRTNPCKNQGICEIPPDNDLEDYDLGYECHCTSNWHGPQCQFVNDCFPGVACQNGGTCDPTPPTSAR